MDNKYVQQFKKGSLEMILLSLIGRKETYGYEIITELNSSASVLGYAKEGTIYPTVPGSDCIASITANTATTPERAA